LQIYFYIAIKKESRKTTNANKIIINKKEAKEVKIAKNKTRKIKNKNKKN